MSAPIRTPTPHRFTVTDVRGMIVAGLIDPDHRLELLDGELIDMASEGIPHLSVKARLSRFFHRTLQSPWLTITDSTLHLSPEDAPEPDIYVVDEPRLGIPTSPEGVPLVIEVADSSLAHDLERKRFKYAQYDLPEYWVVDLRGRATVVFTGPGRGRYAERVTIPFETVLTPTRLPEAAVRIADLES